MSHVRASVINHNSDMLGRISFKLDMIMDLPSGHMHVKLFFDPIQDDRLAAIFVVKTGTLMTKVDITPQIMGLELKFKHFFLGNDI